VFNFVADGPDGYYTYEGYGQMYPRNITGSGGTKALDDPGDPVRPNIYGPQYLTAIFYIDNGSLFDGQLALGFSNYYADPALGAIFTYSVAIQGVTDTNYYELHTFTNPQSLFVINDDFFVSGTSIAPLVDGDEYEVTIVRRPGWPVGGSVWNAVLDFGGNASERGFSDVSGGPDIGSIVDAQNKVAGVALREFTVDNLGDCTLKLKGDVASSVAFGSADDAYALTLRYGKDNALTSLGYSPFEYLGGYNNNASGTYTPETDTTDYTFSLGVFDTSNEEYCLISNAHYEGYPEPARSTAIEITAADLQDLPIVGYGYNNNGAADLLNGGSITDNDFLGTTVLAMNSWRDNDGAATTHFEISLSCTAAQVPSFAGVRIYGLDASEPLKDWWFLDVSDFTVDEWTPGTTTLRTVRVTDVLTASNDYRCVIVPAIVNTVRFRANQPDWNSPKGHIIVVDVVTSGTNGTEAKRDEDLDQALGLDSTWAENEKMSGVGRKAVWADLDDSSTFEEPNYTFDDIEAWCQTAADAGKVCWIGVIWRSFDRVESMPPWLASDTYRSWEEIGTTGYGTTCARMEKADVAGYYMDLLTALGEHMTGKPGFAGVITSETALQHGGELTSTTGPQFRDNLKDVFYHTCETMPDYNHFTLGNFLNYPNSVDGGGISSGELYDVFTETYDALALIGQSNMILCSPDIIPYQKALSLTNKNDSYRTDRLYATWREINKTHPSLKMSSWIQYNSFKIKPHYVTNKTEGAWGLPDTTHAGDVADLWSMEEVFLWYLEQNFHSEWVLWNWLDYGAQHLERANQGGQVIRDYPSWERPVNLIDCNVAKNFTTGWTATGIDSVDEDNDNYDAQYQKRKGSHGWVEDTATSQHKYVYTIPAADFQVGEVYTVAWFVHQIPGEETRRFRLEATSASGVGADISSCTFNVATLTFDREYNNAADPRYQEAWAVKDYVPATGASVDTGHLEYYYVQMDFIPVADAADTNDISIHFKLADATNDITDWVGSGSANAKIGECSVFYKNRK